MEIDPPVALDANTGAIALANKSLQIRDKYPDSDDERSSSKTTTPKSSPLHRISPYLKPKNTTTTKVATMPKIIYENISPVKTVHFKSTKPPYQPTKVKTFLKNMTTSKLRELNPRPNKNP